MTKKSPAPAPIPPAPILPQTGGAFVLDGGVLAPAETPIETPVEAPVKPGKED
jgi:hypothetical protein